MLAPVSSYQAIHYGGNISGFSNANELNQKDDIEPSENKNSIQSKITQKAFDELSKHEQEKIQQLKRRDLEVKAHEQAHLSPSLTTQ